MNGITFGNGVNLCPSCGDNCVAPVWTEWGRTFCDQGCALAFFDKTPAGVLELEEKIKSQELFEDGVTHTPPVGTKPTFLPPCPTTVNLTISGDVLDSEKTGLEICKIIEAEFEKQKPTNEESFRLWFNSTEWGNGVKKYPSGVREKIKSVYLAACAFKDSFWLTKIKLTASEPIFEDKTEGARRFHSLGIKQDAIKILYVNHRHSIDWRKIIPMEVYFGESKWHVGMQYFLKAFDCDKKEVRDFALIWIKSFGRDR